jgi:colicin import membrane protein
MLKLKPVSSVLAALMIASALSGCGGGGVEPVGVSGDAQITAGAVAKAAEVAAAAEAAKAAEVVAAAEAAKAVEAAAAAEAATVAKAAAEAKAAAVAKAKAAAAAEAAAAPPPVAIVYYENCTAVRAAGADPIHRGDPGYSSKLDRDGDGIACE